MPVVYVPKDTRYSDALSGGLDTFIKTKIYSDDKNQRDAAYRLQTLMELGGQTNQAEVSGLEKTLNLSPGQLSSVMVVDKTTGAMRLPSRLERESTSALGTYEKKGEIEESQAAKFSPARTARLVAEQRAVATGAEETEALLRPSKTARQIVTQSELARGAEETAQALSPARTARLVGEARAVKEMESAVGLEELRKKKEIEQDAAISLAREVDKLGQELKDKNLPAEIRRKREERLAEIKTEIEANITKAGTDPATKLANEKINAEIDKIKSEAEENRATAEYYRTTKREEVENKANKQNIAKMNEINEFLVQAGAATKDDKGKIRPKPIEKDSPLIKQITDKLTAEGFSVEIYPVEKFAQWARPEEVTIGVVPVKIKGPNSYSTSSRKIESSVVKPKTRKEYFQKLKEANPGATDKEINDYLDEEGIK